MREQVKGADLKLGDVVQTFDGAFNTAVVVKIEPGEHVMLFWPFATTSGFETTGGVIPYIGFEQYPIWMTNTVWRLQKGEVR